MSLEIVLAMIIFRYLRRFAQTGSLPDKWQRLFQIGFFASLALFILDLLIQQDLNLFRWAGQAILVYIIYLIYTEAEFRPLKWMILAVAPVVVVNIIDNVIDSFFPALYKDTEEYFEMVSLGAVLWGAALLWYTRNQRKSLELERQRLKEKEEQFRMSEIMKKELEIQVAERTEDIRQQKEELEHTLTELKSTQAQLIQSEKMASLGELTAGIAHEIQNPLNFVTNFSDVSMELVDEMIQELNKQNPNEAIAIAADLKVNLSKILHHGNRADGIVKGMLQHSRSSTGQKEPTDINVLADEYLRLAYHGLRAKDKNFNAILKTEFDDSIGKLELVPQDIGRVILNLITNAFYVVNERKNSIAAGPQATTAKPYEPTVSVITRKRGNMAEIKIRDNGNGIPADILDKIFQPFFTTKPTGQGTGLGLSLSYDIIKAHGGELKVENRLTAQGTGAEFTIVLPLQP